MEVVFPANHAFNMCGGKQGPDGLCARHCSELVGWEKRSQRTYSVPPFATEARGEEGEYVLQSRPWAPAPARSATTLERQACRRLTLCGTFRHGPEQQHEHHRCYLWDHASTLTNLQMFATPRPQAGLPPPLALAAARVEARWLRCVTAPRSACCGRRWRRTPARWCPCYRWGQGVGCACVLRGFTWGPC